MEDVIMKINEISKQIYNNQRIIGSYFEGGHGISYCYSVCVFLTRYHDLCIIYVIIIMLNIHTHF